jgi:hypothetical protein
MATTISRTWYDTLTDDDGSLTVGTAWDKAAVDSLLDAIDALIAGNIVFGGTLSASGFGTITSSGAITATGGFISDPTGGTSIWTYGAASNVQAIRIVQTNAGGAGAGYGNSLFRIDNRGNNDFLSFDNNGTNAFSVGNAGHVEAAGTQTWTAYGAGTATFDASGNITSVSDRRFKNRIRPLPYGLAEVLKLQPIQHGYNKRSGLERKHLYGGFSAQDVKKAMPLAVGRDARGYLTLSDRPILGATVHAIHELHARLARLERKAASTI